MQKKCTTAIKLDVEQELRYDSSAYEDDVVSRMYTARLKKGERYDHLALLLYVRGAKSSGKYCRTDSKLCPTYKGPCGEKSLLAKDKLWNSTLQEPFISNFVSITNVFAAILVSCSLSNPNVLRTKQENHFFLDFRTDTGKLAYPSMTKSLKKRLDFLKCKNAL